jgi:hypothetical protein
MMQGRMDELNPIRQIKQRQLPTGRQPMIQIVLDADKAAAAVFQGAGKNNGGLAASKFNYYRCFASLKVCQNPSHSVWRNRPSS